MDGWGGGVKCSCGGVEPSLSLVAASLSAVLASMKQLPFHLDKLITESLWSPLPHHLRSHIAGLQPRLQNARGERWWETKLDTRRWCRNTQEHFRNSAAINE